MSTNAKTVENFLQLFPSQRRGKTICCTKECASDLRKVTSKGNGNSNYRHGAHCTTSICECGNEKDYRAIRCSDCAKSKKPTIGYDDSDESLLVAVKNSRSYVEVSKLVGQARSTVRKRVNSLKIDVSHFRSSKNRRPKPEDIFKIYEKRVNGLLRKYILDFDIIDYICSTCGLADEWNNKPLTLQLDHINGNPKDNRIHNLRWLCPNCHTQTSNYCGRNINVNK